MQSTQPASPDQRPRILLCSAWQIVNIGDIAHTPAALSLLETHFPEALVTLWPFKPLTPAATDLLLRRFPALQVVEGTLKALSRPTARLQTPICRTPSTAPIFSFILPAPRCSAGRTPKRSTRARSGLLGFMA